MSIFNSQYNPFSKKNVGSAFKNVGKALNLPEMGISEMFGVTPAKAAPGGAQYANGGMTNATEWQTKGYPSESAWLQANASGYNGDYSGFANYLFNLNSKNGSGSGPSSSTFDQWFNGQHYTDPVEYANAVNSAAVEAYNTATKSLQDAYTKGLIDLSAYEEQLKQNRENIKTQYGDAMGVVSGRFAAQGPNVYQSEQGNKEGIIKDVTNQNYANQATAEANLGMQKTGFENEYANLNQQNRENQQARIDETMNSLSSNLAGTPYANSLSRINAPTINNATLDNSIMGTYNALSGMKGNGPAIKSTIDASNQPQNIKDWLYSRFANQVAV